MTPSEVAVAAFDRIVEHPEQWDQECWHDGDGRGCFAYHVALVVGATDFTIYEAATDAAGNFRTIRQIATDALELDWATSVDLFSLSNDLDRIARILREQGLFTTEAKTPTLV